MNTNLNTRDFSGTGIKTPAEKMRAMAIITAKDDVIGLSKINFSITLFIQKGSFQDICYILGQWAIEPISRSPGKFIRFPAAGKEALATRADALLKNLERRIDFTRSNIYTLKTYMHNAIENRITYQNHGANTDTKVQRA